MAYDILVVEVNIFVDMEKMFTLRAGTRSGQSVPYLSDQLREVIRISPA